MAMRTILFARMVLPVMIVVAGAVTARETALGKERVLPIPLPEPDQSADLETAKLQELLNTVRITPFEAERLNTIKKESVQELVDHLPADGFFSMGPLSGGGDIISFSYAPYVNKFVPRLARVRRLLAEAKTDRETVCKELRRALAEVNKRWVAATENTRRKFETGDMTLREDDPETSAAITASAAVYVLGELGDYGALNIFLESYSLFDEEPGDPSVTHVAARRGPVPAGTLLYGVYKLIEAYADGSLSEPQRALKARFLEQAAQLFPPPETKTVSRWDSQYRKFDPRIREVFPRAQQSKLELQPTEEITVWPAHSRSGADLSDLSGASAAETRQLFASKAVG